MTAEASQLATRLTNLTGERTLPRACERLVDTLLPDARVNGPVNVEWLCERAKIPILVTPNAPYEGRLDRSVSGKARISIRRFTSYEEVRKRFTIAHELGHWIVQETLGEHKETLFRGMPVAGTARREEETIANLLAAEILMPRKRMDPIIRESLSFALISKALGMFQVSMPAFLWRFSDCAERVVMHLRVIPAFLKRQQSPSVIDNARLWSSYSKMIHDRNALSFATKFDFPDCERHCREGVEMKLYGKEYGVWVFDTACRIHRIPTVDLVSDKAPTYRRRCGSGKVSDTVC